jgi:hypothetical protein
MDQQQRTALQDQLARTHGTSFENLVVTLLRATIDQSTWAPPTYRPDGGCDAYVPSRRTIYQIYGPVGAVTEKEICDKLRTDADKLRLHWDSENYPITQFFFVVNLPAPPLVVQQAAMSALPGITGSALGRGNLVALANALSPSQAESHLGLPAFPVVEDRKMVSAFLNMLDRYCGGVPTLWSTWGFSASAYYAMRNGGLQHELANGSNPLMSRDDDIHQLQVQLVNAILGVMRTVVAFGDVHEEREDGRGPNHRIVGRAPVPPFDPAARARHQRFDTEILPQRQDLRRCYESLHQYAHALPPGLDMRPLPLKTWNHRLPS